MKSFIFEDNSLPVTYISTLDVAPGVKCDTYVFDNDNTKDLAIIKIDSGCKTPLQKVLEGDKTIEGYISGYGQLIIHRSDNQLEIYEFPGTPTPFSVNIRIGDTMQWQADQKSNLIVYEVCFPPYQDGRYENIK